MQTSEVILRTVKQIQWSNEQTKRINAYREEKHEQPSFITEENPHSFTYNEIMEITPAQHVTCSIIKELINLK